MATKTLEFVFNGSWDGYGGTKHHTFTDFGGVPGRVVGTRVVSVEDRETKSNWQKIENIGETNINVSVNYSSFTDGIHKYDSTVTVEVAYDPALN
ncbi:hypothetical protein EST62_13240 [Chlorobaculum sp. 24CR]|uniref:hypothetical protein n=1 Tax=Chlorobaculum sp. 24CR TaxID=2508878 RepID=UPI00100B4080|nr:hypothetical protein [Chlorobaculum sp. 24CR]RXK79915.1 hypothetical protein EST62_13240 [Chlorobaculum sp. 24CR]